MSEAKKTEILNLLARGIIRVMLKENLSFDGKVLPDCFVLVIKSTPHGQEKYKTHDVTGGHWDKLKNLVVHSSLILQLQYICLMLSIAKLFEYEIWTSDVMQSCFQSSEPLARNIFIEMPVLEFTLDPLQFLQLLEFLNGLWMSVYLWHPTLENHHGVDLAMRLLGSDPAHYLLSHNGKLKGLSGGYLGNLIQTEDDESRNLSKKTNERFDVADGQSILCFLLVFEVSAYRDRTLLQNQHNYLQKLKKIPAEASYSEFCALQMRVAWLADTRPDFLFEILKSRAGHKEFFFSV